MSPRLLRVTALVPWLSRAAGGLFDAVRNLTLEMERQHRYLPSVIGFDDSKWEVDRPLWGNIQTQALPVRGPRAFGFAPGMAKALRQKDPDLLHVHGLWMYSSAAAIRWARKGRPYIVSPHGMLDPWALKNSRWKKGVCAALYENRHLRGAACLHALNETEARAIRAYGLRNPLCVIPNGVELPGERDVGYPKSNRYLLYLGRLHPKKGLPALIAAWSQIQRSAIEAEWHLNIAGWDQNGHRSELETLTKKLHVDATISFLGPQFGEAKARLFQEASAFILPSLSEGMPMTVLEAWSWQLPVVITPNCNLPEGAGAGAGIVTEPDVESIAVALRELISMSDAQLQSMGRKGRRLVEERFQWPCIVRQVTQVYDWVLGFGSQPACIVG